MQRQQEITAWIESLYPARAFTLMPASADASFRRYFRATFADGETLIVMDAPPSHEDCKPWLHVQQLFAAAGVHVPQVLAQDLVRGYLLLSDLGNQTYLPSLTVESAPALYGDALDALIELQAASQPGRLPEYDEPLLRRELMLFPEWYLGKHMGVTLDDKQQRMLETIFQRILTVNLAEPRVYVHRDYHARNLMVANPNPGVIDFQDAVYGPMSYDLVSLFKDAYISWDEEIVIDWLVRYWEKARKRGLPIRDDFGDFYRDYEWMGVQRHLKVLGIFARLYHRDGKDGYLKDMPLVLDYLRRTCARYDGLLPLLRLIDKVHGTDVKTGMTF
ncbi:MAG TPA: phosphotransferase [Rhodocyclaceae bacterium]|nr:phosphotransferase [Rhodocyclaceae bacterium]